MEESELLKQVEENLNKNFTKSQLPLYKEIRPQPSNMTAQSIIASVTTQLKAIRKADETSRRRESASKLLNYKKSSLVPVNMLACNEQVPQSKVLSKFETQFELDSQLVEFIQNAEAQIDASSGISQEFNYSFHNPEEENCEAKSTNNCTVDIGHISSSHQSNHIHNSKLLDHLHDKIKYTNKLDYQNVENYSNVSSNSYEMVTNKNDKEKLTDSCEISSSYVFQTPRKSNTPSPLVFDLNKFEDFEKSAFPLIEEQFHSTKHYINSQLLSREISFQIDNDPPSKTSNIEVSPIIKMNSTHIEINKYIDDNDKEYIPVPDCKSSSIFSNDEILFSSDEESDNTPKNFQDLPLTSALETSFYDHSDVLDKTMYVGFQTANNKSIQISTDSFTKAKSLLDSLDKNSTPADSLIELVIKCDTGTKTKTLPMNFDILDSHSQLQTKHSATGVEQENISTMKMNEEIKQCNVSIKREQLADTRKLSNSKCVTESVFKIPEIPLKRKFDGFMTASNKKIKLSDQALSKSRKIFRDIDLDYDSDLNVVHYDRNVRLVSSSENIEMETKGNQELDESVLKEFYEDQYEDDKQPTNFVSKAVGKNYLHIPETRNKTKNTCDHMQSDPGISKVISHSDLRKYSTVLKDDNTYSDTEVPKFVTFKTAGNKDIEISKKAFIKSMKILDNLDESNDYNLNLLNRHLKFDSASSNTIDAYEYIQTNNNEVSVDAVTKSDFNNDNKHTRDTNLNKCMEKSHEIHAFIGFKTANNKDIKISEEAYIKTKNLFHNIAAGVDGDPSTIEEYTKESNLVLNRDQFDLDIEDINKIQTDLCDEDFNSEFAIAVINIPSPTLCGFKTASNEGESKKVFADLDHKDNLELKSLKTKSKSDMAVPKNLELPFKNNEGIKIAQEAGVIHINALTGNIHVSDKSIEMGIHDREDYNKKKCDKENLHTIFQTGSQKPVEISKEALVQSRRLLTNTENTKPNFNENEFKTSVTFMGFQTANMKAIPVSTDALAKSKELFRDIDDLHANLSGKSDTITNKLYPEVKSGPSIAVFQTASKRPITISDTALAKSKLLFKDIDVSFDSNDTQLQGFHTASDRYGYVPVSKETLLRSKFQIEDNDSHIKGGQIATKKCEELVKESLKSNIEINMKIPNIKKRDETNFTKNIASQMAGYALKTPEICKNNCRTPTQAVNILNSKVTLEPAAIVLEGERLIDTQIIHNFDSSLHTEDFCKGVTPKQSKRSGSPILSCPKAKKRKKFETPYKTQLSSVIDKTTIESKLLQDSIYDTTYLFTQNYKKNKRFRLLDLVDAEKSILSASKMTTDPILTKFTYDSLLDLEFYGSRNDLNDTTRMTVEDIKKIFTSAVNKKIIPKGWVDNHIRLIIWKLISYEVKFKNAMSGVCSVRNVLDQLKYRYDKELYDAERPILRKILEKDDLALKTMVLCVVDVYVDGVRSNSVTKMASNVELMLTDGWYCVKAVLDLMLTKLVFDEKIKVGYKIITNGAELLNCDQGVAPWEDTSSVRLKIFGNSTRLARWDARLGCYRSGAVLTRLSSVQPGGGKVSKLRVYVARVYPPLFIEKFEDGSTVTRTERLEHIHQIKYESERQSAMEKLYEEVEKELSDQESQDYGSGVSNKKISYGSQDNFSSHITESQVKSLEERSNRRREKILKDIENKVQEKLKKYGCDVKRNVVQLLKVRVADIVEKNGAIEVTKALVSIWKPNEAITEIVKEGNWIEILNVIPTAVRYSEVQISAGRNSVVLECKREHSDKILPYTKILSRKCYTAKELVQHPTAATDYNEIDTAGFIFQIEPSNSNFETSKQPFQNVYFADAEKNIICVNFWGGLQKFGYQNILDTGQVYACINLQKRTGNTKKSIPHYRVTEFSYFTKTPKDAATRKLVDVLVKQLTGSDKKRFLEDCSLMKSKFSKLYNGNSHISPYRINNDHSLLKNNSVVGSPLIQRPVDDLNLTGLDFESTFKQESQLSPNLLLRKKKVNEKIARLKMYGEPPPLSPMHIINKTKSALKEYKSPLASENVVKIIPGNSNAEKTKDIQSSPVMTLNHTRVKNLNPVKLNFSNVQDKSIDDVKDHFAEEFDGSSPPLSLD